MRGKTTVLIRGSTGSRRGISRPPRRLRRVPGVFVGSSAAPLLNGALTLYSHPIPALAPAQGRMKLGLG